MTANKPRVRPHLEAELESVFAFFPQRGEATNDLPHVYAAILISIEVLEDSLRHRHQTRHAHGAQHVLKLAQCHTHAVGGSAQQPTDKILSTPHSSYVNVFFFVYW